MIAKYKEAFRAWLIDLVREAIRVEKTIEASTLYRATPRKQIEPHKPIIDGYPGAVSYEQMEANAIKSQEKYYEPERLQGTGPS